MSEKKEKSEGGNSMCENILWTYFIKNDNDSQALGTTK